MLILSSRYLEAVSGIGFAPFVEVRRKELEARLMATLNDYGGSALLHDEDIWPSGREELVGTRKGV